MEKSQQNGMCYHQKTGTCHNFNGSINKLWSWWVVYIETIFYVKKMSSKIVVPFFKTDWICLKNLGCLPQPRGFLGSQDFDGKLHSQKEQDEDIQDMVAL